jgi:hypothetical protein
MPFTLALHIKRVVLEKRSTRRSQEGSTSMIKIMWRPLGVVVAFLALGGIGAATTQYLYEPYNPGFLKYSTIVALHVLLGGLYLMVAFVLHSSLAEVWIRLTRRSSGPGSSTKILYKRPAPTR